MGKKTKSAKKNSRKKIITGAIIAGATGLILSAIVAGIYKVRDYNDASNQAHLVEIRELILLAVRGVKKDAPVDPRTGDIYFPESKLYLPNPQMALPLTYQYDNSQRELSISTYPVWGTQGLYSARDQQDLFDAVPKLQACSRGIKIVQQKFPAKDTQNKLRYTVQVNDGRTLYVYLEKACPELNRTADIFKEIKSY